MQSIVAVRRFDLLVREGNEDVVLGAGTRGHVLFFVVKLVVAGLGASDHLSQGVVLRTQGPQY